MRLMQSRLFAVGGFLAAFLLSGCAPLARLVVADRDIRIPQVLAYLEPVLNKNTIAILGKIVIQNPTQSDLALDKMHLIMKGDHNVILGEEVLEWNSASVKSREELEAPVAINLNLSALNNTSISIFIKTAFMYKRFGLRIPVENKVAVLNLDALKEAVSRPFSVAVYTKLRLDALGNASIDYVLTMVNPLRINLVLEDGEIGIYTLQGNTVAKSAVTKTLFQGAESNRIKGSIKIGNVLGKLMRIEFIKRRPLRFRFSGKMQVEHTDIAMPFNIESVQEIAFSFLGY